MSPRWEPDPDIRRGNHVVHYLHVHLVFVTKYRREIFDDQMLTRCEAVMRDVCESFEAELHEFSGGAPLSIVKDYIENQKRPA